MKYIEKILHKVAKVNNTTVENVYKEITFAIENAMENSSPDALEILKSISETNVTPTPEEFIIYFCNNLSPHCCIF